MVNIFLLSSVLGNDSKIVIVGAGPAGLAAPTHLLSNNFSNVQILEAEPRIGSRIHSVDFGKGKIDIGAQWCHGQKGSVVYDYVKNLDLLESSVRGDKFYHSTRLDVDTDFSKELYQTSENTVDEMERSASKMDTMGEYFTNKYVYLFYIVATLLI